MRSTRISFLNFNLVIKMSRCYTESAFRACRLLTVVKYLLLGSIVCQKAEFNWFHSRHSLLSADGWLAGSCRGCTATLSRSRHFHFSKDCCYMTFISLDLIGDDKFQSTAENLLAVFGKVKTGEWSIKLHFGAFKLNSNRRQLHARETLATIVIGHHTGKYIGFE